MEVRLHIKSRGYEIISKDMSYRTASSKIRRRALRCLLPTVCLSASLMSQDIGQERISGPVRAVSARVVLGLEGIANNTTGELSIQNDALIFHRVEGPMARIPLGSIQNAFLSQEDKQVGGTPMALGRAATPFGGGRAIGLFAHKKYDLLTLEYWDSNGGFRGAIWQLSKGQGPILAENLDAKGVHVTKGLDTHNAK
jgi:hypothetical protein